MRIAAKDGEEGVRQSATLAVKGIAIAVLALNESRFGAARSDLVKRERGSSANLT